MVKHTPRSSGVQTGSIGTKPLPAAMFSLEAGRGLQALFFWTEDFKGIGVHLNHRDVTSYRRLPGPDRQDRRVRGMELQTGFLRS
jgi:hypothetical protein